MAHAMELAARLAAKSMGRAACGVSLRLVFGCFLLLPLLSGCQSARFYRQAVTGHWEVLTERERVDRLLARAETPGVLKEQLSLAEELCRFAESELGLPARGQYRHYADLGRPYVVWNIFAAPEFSFEAKTWCYPVVGRLDYQGYFREAMAWDYARRLAQRGDGWRGRSTTRG